MVAAAPVLPAGYIVSASPIADRRMMLAGYRLAYLLTRLWAGRKQVQRAGFTLGLFSTDSCCRIPDIPLCTCRIFLTAGHGRLRK